MVNSLRKVDFSHPTGHYTWKKIAPLEKILGAPLSNFKDEVSQGEETGKWHGRKVQKKYLSCDHFSTWLFSGFVPPRLN